MLFFAKEYHYTKTDIEELTVREKSNMLSSNLAVFYKESYYYEDMSKYASLGLIVANMLGAELESIENLIGSPPTLKNSKNRTLTDKDLEIIDSAKRHGIKYEITSDGIRLG